MLDKGKVLAWIENNLVRIDWEGEYIKPSELIDAITNGDFDVKEDSK